MSDADKKRSSSERLNLTIAVCAILVSVASFYATYLQARSARQQVNAMTLPLIEFSHDNYDETENVQALSFTLRNAGIGPAIIRNVSFSYEGADLEDTSAFFRACCGPQFNAYQRREAELVQQPAETSLAEAGGRLTQPLENAVIPGQTDLLFLKLYRAEINDDLWQLVDSARWALSLRVCYCSLLDDCFVTETGRAVQVVIQEVDDCAT